MNMNFWIAKQKRTRLKWSFDIFLDEDNFGSGDEDEDMEENIEEE